MKKILLWGFLLGAQVLWAQDAEEQALKANQFPRVAKMVVQDDSSDCAYKIQDNPFLFVEPQENISADQRFVDYVAQYAAQLTQEVKNIEGGENINALSCATITPKIDKLDSGSTLYVIEFNLNECNINNEKLKNNLKKKIEESNQYNFPEKIAPNNSGVTFLVLF